MSKSTECPKCPKCQGNLPLPTACTHLHPLPFFRRSSSPIPSLDLKSGSILRLDLPAPTRPFLTLMRTYQLCLCLLNIPPQYSILSPWRESSSQPWGPHCHCARSLPGDSVSITFHGAGIPLTPPETTQGHGSCWRWSWIPAWCWCWCCRGEGRA